MRVEVIYCGVLRELFAAHRQEIFLAEGDKVDALLQVLKEKLPVESKVWASLAVAVNDEYAGLRTRLKDGDEVALLPPVSGGSGTQLRVEIHTRAIPTATVIDEIKAGEDGAVCVFDGIVRNNSRGRETLYLDYEAREAMALRQMNELAAEAVTRFGVRDVAMLHRLGRIHVGETSVLIVVASGHRNEAFDACRWLIDSLKKQVPIWKRETFVDGVVWDSGDAFPEALVPRKRG